MERIHCVLHQESTPSLVVYDTHAYCFGGCGRIELSQLGREVTENPKPRYREDLEERREYIDALPKKVIRGFMFPADSSGYYIVWPNSHQYYYKRRNWASDGSKYCNPSGHSQPLFIARNVSSKRLFLVEGEINALSVAVSFPEDSVISPGSASDFQSDKFRSDLTQYINYRTIVLVVDRDGPGVAAAIHAKSLLLGKTPNVSIVLMSKDANDWLLEDGPEALRSQIENEMSLKL